MFYLLTRDFYWGLGEGMMAGFLGLFIGALVYFGVSFWGSYKAETVYDLVYTKEVLALETNNSVRGSFFLGSGTVDGRIVYAYMTKENDGVKINTVDQSLVYLNEDSSKRVIEAYTPVYKNQVLQFLFINMNDPKFKFYIPKDTIKYNYNVDLN